MRATLLVAALLCAGAARAAGLDGPFDRDEIVVDNCDFLLLTEKGYSFDSEGMLRAANKMTVSREDAAYILEDLRSRRRLADLLEIKIIQDRTAVQGVMTREDKAALRRIGQRDWPILSKSARESLKSVFTDKEVYDLNASSPKALSDISVVDRPDVRPSQAHAAVPLHQPVVGFGGALMPLAVQAPPVQPVFVPSQPAPVAPVAPVAPPPPVVAAPPPPPPVVVAPPAPPAPVAVPEPVAPPPPVEAIPADIKPLPAPDWSVLKPVAPAPAPVVPEPAPVPPPAPVAVTPVVAAPPPPPPPAPVAAPAVPAPAPLPSEDELETAPEEPPAPPKPPASAARAPDVLLATLPPAVIAAINAPAPPPPAAAAAAGLPPPAPIPAAGFKVETAAPPPVRQAEGLSPAALSRSVQVSAPVVPPPAAPVPEGPAYPPVTPDAFSAFLGQAPYGREEKSLLAMISANLPEPDRTRALGVLMKRLPHVILDSRRAGAESRVSVTFTAQPGQPPRETVAIHDGPVFRSADAFLKADQAWLLPDDPAFYTARGLPVPSGAAFSRESASAGEQATKWGRARVYPDGTKRLSRSETVLAGALTRGLLLLDARTRIPGDAVGAELAARVGEFRLYQVLEKAADKEPPLDKETLALYSEWRDRPMDFIDTMAHGFFAAGAGTRIAGEAGLGVGKEPLAAPIPLPAAGSPSEAAWLESERLSREVRE